MLFSRNWLAEYVELPGDPAELAAGLTGVGLAVEGIEERGGDVLLDVDVTTNRPDAMCHLGLAREIAVHWDRPLREPETAVDEAAAEAAGAVSVELADPGGCPRYVVRVVRGVEVGPSPRWLQERLASIGLRPINNVVDVTNFVLWETGQPLHAFDLAKVDGAKIVVRRAAAGEKLVTLDEEERELSPEVLVIADAGRAVALAGVMGGLDSEVTADTGDVLLESAHFDRRRVRIGARELSMHTDASHRFERGADPGACRRAADRAARLLAEVAGGTVLAGAVDARAEGFEDRFDAHGRLAHGRLVAFAGVPMEPAGVERWMTGLGFGLEREPVPEPAWRVTAPTWRWYDMEPGPDGAIYEQDLFEEVLRHHGYDGIPATLPALPGSDGPRTAEQVRRDRIRDHLAACGYAEAVNYAFQSGGMDASLPHLAPGESHPVELVNPLSERYAFLRRSLVPNLVASAVFNRRRGVESVRLFEVGHVFWHPGEPGGAVAEQEAVAVLCGGTLGTPWDRRVELDLFDLKGVLDTLGEVLETPVAVRAADLRGVVAGTAAEVLVGGEPAGWLGRVDEADAGYPLYAAELRTASLGAGVIGGQAEVQVRVPSRFPTVEADLTLTHAEDTPWADLRAAIESRRPADLAEFGLKDRYTGEGVPEGAVNTTLWFLYAHPERTLTQDEVNDRQQALTEDLQQRFGWRG
jgi:phenylalanyl-tRNA synthetase beta chain